MSNLKPLILHAHSTGPNPYKIAIVLEHLGLPYEVKLWQMGPGKNNGLKGDAFLKLNPSGRVPALEDPNSGTTSWESGAIANSLIRLYDKDHKVGPGPSEQDKIDFDKWTFWLVGQLGPMMGQVNWFRHFHSSKNEDALKRYVDQANYYIGVLDGHLKKSKSGFVLDKGFTAVDAQIYAWLAVAPFAQLDLGPFSAVKAYVEKVQNMPETKRAYEKVPKGENVAE